MISANHYETLKSIQETTIKMMGAKPHGGKPELGAGPLDPNNQ